MTGSTAGDGRLDLDDLGGVLERAEALPAERDVLTSGSAWSLGDRLRESRPGRWLGRHAKQVVLVTAGVGLVAGGAAAYLSSRPAPVDPTLRVLVTAMVPTSSGDEAERLGGSSLLLVRPDGVVRAGFGLLPIDPTDRSRYRILGITGSVVRASQATTRDDGAGNVPFNGDVDTVVDCGVVLVEDVPPGEHELLVERTDSYGRTLTGRLPFGTDTQWWEVVTQNCLQDALFTAFTLDQVSVRADPSARAVDVTARVSSSLPVVAAVQAYVDPSAPLSWDVPLTRVPAQGTRTLTVHGEVHDCSRTSAPVVDAYSPYRGTRSGPGVGAEVAAPGIWGAATSGWGPLQWSDEVQAQVQAALSSVCAGAPKPALQVASARAVRSTEPVAGARVEVVLSVATSGTTVSTETVDDGSTVLPGATGAVRDGRATLSTTLTFPCSSPPGPPWLHLAVTTREGTYPFQQTLDGAALAAAVGAACGFDDTQLTDAGWQLPGSA